jgi:chromate transporter
VRYLGVHGSTYAAGVPKLCPVAIDNWLTAVIAPLSLLVLFRWKVSNPLLIAATAVVGIIAFPLLNPGWVFVK